MEVIVTTRAQLSELIREAVQRALEELPQTSERRSEIIDREELCRRLAVTEPTVIRWEKKGRIPRLEIGSAVRYDWPRVVEALERGCSR